MRRVLLTGMSGTGKSSVVAELTTRGFTARDTDDGLCRIAPDGEWLWDEKLVEELLATEGTEILFVAGTASNQVRFYDRFDDIILLSAPADVLVERLATRTTNSYGKVEHELVQVLDNLRTVEPMLRRIATHEIVTTTSLSEVVDEIVQVVAVAAGHGWASGA